MISRSSSKQRDRGAGLIELVIVLLLGTLLIAGVLAAHQRASAVMRTAETIARLQDTGRLALDVLEADVRMAGFWGRFGASALVANRASPDQPLPAPFTPMQGARIDTCGGAGSRWAIDLDTPVDGTDDAYGLACAPAIEARSGADTLVLRRATEAPSASLAADRIHLQASLAGGALFVPSPDCADPLNAACLPVGFSPETSQSRALVVRAYYVASSSTREAGVPALRRKSFGNVNAAGAASALVDEEIAAGIEDLQVRFGVDQDGDGSVDGHADPGAIPVGATVVTATVWLLVRAEDRESGHVDPTEYRYGSMVAPYIPGDAYRRIVVFRTVELRNAPP